MSFYVESVSHTWQFPNKLTTHLTVTRGQPNNPAPMYVLPALDAFNSPTIQRKSRNSRLAQYFLVPDTMAVQRGIVIRNDRDNAVFQADPRTGKVNNSVNSVDSDENLEFYGERIIPAGGEGVGFISSAVNKTATEEVAPVVSTEVPPTDATPDQAAGIVGPNQDAALPGVPTPEAPTPVTGG